MTTIDLKEVAELLSNSAIVGGVSFALKYLSSVVSNLKSLNMKFTELTYEMKSMGERQNIINDTVEKRISSLEKKL